MSKRITPQEIRQLRNELKSYKIAYDNFNRFLRIRPARQSEFELWMLLKAIQEKPKRKKARQK